MRARLWPECDASGLARDVHAFFAGGRVPALDAAFVARDEDERPVGFLELSIRPFSDGCDSIPVPHVEGWYVEERARKQGVGRALLHAAEEWAHERGFTELASDTELSNHASQSAHLACGFGEVDRLVKFRKKL